jgi:hypothetical protein
LGLSVKSIRVKALLVLAILLASTGIMSNAALKAETVPLDAKDNLEVLAYASDLSLYPGDTLDFNVIVENYASVACTASLIFSLNDTVYQESYVTFSSNIYTIEPGTNTLDACLSVADTAPEAQLKLTIQIIQDADVPPTPTPSPTPPPIEFPISMDLFVAGAKWAANGGNSVLYINWYDSYCAHHASDGATWGPWWREGQLSEIKDITVEALEQQGFTVTCAGDVPADLSCYNLVIFEALFAIEPKHVEQVRNYMADGGNVVTLGGVPCFFSTYCKTLWPYRVGGTNLNALKDWFGSARFMNTGGNAYLFVDNPFGMSLLNQSLVYYIKGSGCSALTQMSSDSKIIGKWAGGAVYAFTHEYGNGRMYYQAEIDWSTILTHVNRLTLDPVNAFNAVGTLHTVTATVRDLQANNPVPNVLVNFSITDGPNKGLIGQGTTNSSGQTTFSWSSSVPGMDTLCATALSGSDQGNPTINSTATKTWVTPGPLSASVTPVNWTMDLGQNNQFLITPNGGSINYTAFQWYVNGSAQNNQVVSSFIFIPNSTGYFLLAATVTDSTNAVSPLSDNATVTVNNYPNVTIAPIGPLFLNPGENLTLNANATGGSAPIHYQWYEETKKVGTDNANYTFLAGSTFANINVTCAITDSASIPVTVTSNGVLITVNGTAPSPTPNSSSSGSGGSGDSSTDSHCESKQNPDSTHTATPSPTPTPTPPDQFPKPVFLFNLGWVEIAIITLLAIVLAAIAVVTFRSFK